RAELDVVRDEEIEQAVPVEVAEPTGGSPALGMDPRLPGNVPEMPAALIMEQDSGTVAAEVEVVEAVVIVVPDGAAEEVSGDLAQTRLRGYVGEVPVPIPLVEPRLRVHQQHVQAAVVVVVEESAAVADGLQDRQRRHGLARRDVDRRCEPVAQP